jgi:hypothetical protein
LALSALAGQGLDTLVQRIGVRLAPHPPPPGAAVPFTAAQVEELRRMEKRLG